MSVATPPTWPGGEIAWRQRGRALALWLGAAAYVVAPWPPLAMFGGGAALVLALLDPWPAVLILPLAAALYPVPKAVAWLPFAPSEFVALLVVGGGLVVLARDVALRGRPRPSSEGPRPGLWEVGRGDSPWRAATLLFVGGAVLATATALDRGLAARELRVVVLEPAACGYVALRCLRAPSRRGWLAGALILGGVAVAATALVRGAMGDLVVAEGVSRLPALQGSPNQLALYLDRVLPLAAAVAWLAPGSACWWARMALLPLGVVALLTWSAGGWLALWVGALVLTAAGGAWRWAAAVAGLSLALAMAGIALVASGAATLPERLVSHLDPVAGTGLARLTVWQAGWNMALAHPLLGVGPDNFRLLYADYGEAVWREPDLSHPHNLVLDAWLRVGLAGLAGYLGLLALTLRDAWRQAQGPSGWGRALGAGVAAALAASIAHGMVDRDYFGVDLAFTFWLLWALARAGDVQRSMEAQQ